MFAATIATFCSKLKKPLAEYSSIAYADMLVEWLIFLDGNITYSAQIAKSIDVNVKSPLLVSVEISYVRTMAHTPALKLRSSSIHQYVFRGDTYNTPNPNMTDKGTFVFLFIFKPLNIRTGKPASAKSERTENA